MGGRAPQVIWCEGNTTLYFINSETVYAAGGTYDNQTVTKVWSGTDVTATPIKNSPFFINEAYPTCTRVVFDESFASVRPTSCRAWFHWCANLTTIEGLEYLNTSEVTTMEFMFHKCPQLTSLDLSNFNTANVTNMAGMFRECTALETIYVSNEWTVENVTESDAMFVGCRNLVGGQGTTFNYSNPTDKTYAHIDGGESDPGYLTLAAPQAIWCSGNNTLYFNKSLIAYAAGDTYDGQTITEVWSGNDVTATPTDNIPIFINNDVRSTCSRVVFDKSFASVRPTSCAASFNWCGDLTTIEGLKYLNTSKVTTMEAMFNRCKKLTSLDLSNFNTAKVTNMADMFKECAALETIYVSNDWTVNNVTSSEDMFKSCSSLVGGQGTAFNESKIDKDYAHIDGGRSNPGYLTLKADEIALDETSDGNSATISANNSKPCNVTLTRPIVSGNYNTLCLPFDVDNDMLKAKFGDDVELAQLSGTRMENDILIFDFTSANAITAGVPYLIYVSDAVASPITFNAVTVKAGTETTETDFANFIPVFDVTTLDNGNENVLFLGANNTLYYPSASSGNMKGFRAYFEVTGEAQGAKAMVMMDNSQTGVKTILNENLQNEQVYDLQGRKATGRRRNVGNTVTHPIKGLYIVNGKKVIIK